MSIISPGPVRPLFFVSLFGDMLRSYDSWY
jgi:hypothetical protein